MAIRTDATKIAEVIEVDPTATLTIYIEMANELINELCLTSGYSDSRLEHLETLLAAHIYRSLRDMQATSESAGVSQSYQLFTGEALKNSHCGQMLMLYDTAGNFNRLNQKAVEGKGKQPCSVTALVTNDDRAYYARRFNN